MKHWKLAQAPAEQGDTNALFFRLHARIVSVLSCEVMALKKAGMFEYWFWRHFHLPLSNNYSEYFSVLNSTPERVKKGDSEIIVSWGISRIQRSATSYLFNK